MLRKPRCDRAYRIGNLQDVHNLQYAISWSGIVVNDSSLAVVQSWPQCVQTVMLFFASAHRSTRPFRSGARGWDLTLEQLSGAIRRVTGRKCGLSTLKNALAWCRKAGLIATHYKSEPEIEIETRPGVIVTLPGARRKEIAPGKWITLRRAVNVLTAAATRLWCQPGEGSPSDESDPQEPKNSHHHQDDQAFSTKAMSCSTDVRENDLRVQESRPTSSTCHRDEDTSTPRAPSERGTTTRPAKAMPVFEHGDDQSSDTTARAVSGKEERNIGVQRGVSVEKVPSPPRGNWKNSWNNARAALLHSVAKYLSDVPTWQADRIYERLRYETWQYRESSMTPSGNWGQLIGRWKWLSPKEKLRALRTQVIPILNAPPAPSPATNEKLKCGSFPNRGEELLAAAHDAERARCPDVAAMAREQARGGSRKEIEPTVEPSPPPTETTAEQLATADKLGFGASVRRILDRFKN